MHGSQPISFVIPAKAGIHQIDSDSQMIILTFNKDLLSTPTIDKPHGAQIPSECDGKWYGKLAQVVDQTSALSVTLKKIKPSRTSKLD